LPIWASELAIEVYRSVVSRKLGVLEIGLGAALRLWSLDRFFQVMRPLLLRVDDCGIYARSRFGGHRIGWQRLAIVSRKMADAGQLEAAVAAIMARRPGLPTHAPAIATGAK
jgi:hypothetical protein